MEKYYCYIVSNKNRTVVYIGYTDNLNRRVNQHRKGSGAVFTKKYNVYKWLYFKEFTEMKAAKQREKQLKNWYKEWKWNLIKETNPDLLTIEI